MYSAIHDKMGGTNIAVSRDTPVYTDCEGKEISESDRFGWEQNIKITKLEYLLFADESGCNTSQRKDGHIGGTKFIVQKGTTPQGMTSTMDHKFTLLQFTSALGERPSVVLSFFKAKQVKFHCHCRGGKGLIVDPIHRADGEIEYKENVGEGKYYLGGSMCKHNGKVVDRLVFANETGGIPGSTPAAIFCAF